MTTVAQAQSAVQEPKPKRRRLKVELPHIDDPVHSRVEWDRNPDKRFTPMKEYRRRAAASPDLSAWDYGRSSTWKMTSTLSVAAVGNPSKLKPRKCTATCSASKRLERTLARQGF